MEGIDLVIPLAGSAGVASWIGTMIANKTNLINLKDRLDDVIGQLDKLTDKQHEMDKDLELLKAKGHNG